MSSSDTFSTFNEDNTIIRPSPGGRRKQAPTYSPSSTHISEEFGPDVQADFIQGSNPLITNAFSLLSIVSKLRNLAYHHAVNELRDQLITEIRSFGDRSLQQGNLQDHVKIASYFLCALIDETVMQTPWGSQSNWGHHSLLIHFHGEASGGERFFQILDQLKQRPEQNLNLLELAYLCLSLGFEGKYRITGSGIRQIEQFRQELYVLIHRMKDDSNPALSIHWQGLRDVRSALVRYVPIWVIAVVAGALLIMIYMGFAYTINKSSDRVYKQLAAIVREEIKTPVVHPPKLGTKQKAASRSIELKGLLSEEISRNVVEVLDGNILRIYGAFPSGSDRVKKNIIPMLAKIARELQTVRRIVVVGHTDNAPIFSARFQSNWHLSQARAKNVADILIASAPIKAQVRYEGHADSEPIAPNDSSKNRALNRRIDIQFR